MVSQADSSKASAAIDPELPDIAFNEPFLATIRGVRSRFKKAEHVNVGSGWGCFELDGKLPLPIYASHLMTDIERITSTHGADQPTLPDIPPQPE